MLFGSGTQTPKKSLHVRTLSAYDRGVVNPRRETDQPVEVLVSLAQAAAAQARWLDALDLAAQALAADPGQAAAAALVGTARRQLRSLGTAGGELRQVTVMFIDVHGSTTIAARLGPDRMRQLMLEFYEVCVDAVTRYEGRVMRFMGDGVLAQFGYPIAHEDDARRAALAGLAVLDGIRGQAPVWEAHFDEQVAVRIGVDTGVVAVGPVDASPWAMDEIAGDAPNVAFRVQSMAEPMTVRVTENTHRLIEGWFETVPLGAMELRNYPQPVHLHQVLGPSEAETPAEARRRPRPPLIGRDAELAVLREAWDQVAVNGERRVVTITGEPGIGKSRLVEHAVATAFATGASNVSLACSPLHRDSPLRPVKRALARFFRVLPGEEGSDELWLGAIRRRLDQVPNRRIASGQAVGLYGWLLGIRSAVDLQPEELRRQTFEALMDLVEAMAPGTNLVLCAEDVDAADGSTVELLTALLARPPVPMLVLLTGRGPLPEVTTADDALELVGLRTDNAADLVRSVAPDLGEAAIDQLVARSGGVPFFLEEQARAANEAPGRPLAETLELSAFLAARLDELGPELKPLLGEIAVAGEEVRLDVLRRLSDAPPGELDELVSELHRRRVVLRRSALAGEVVRFRHGLMREVAYSSLVEGRRAVLHRRVADVLAELPAAAAVPEEVARHYELAAADDKAAGWWLEAGRVAAASGAAVEAIELFRRSLAALARLPAGEDRARLELEAQLGLGTTLSTVGGYTSPDARAAFERAMALAENLDDSTTIFPALWGAWTYWFVLGEHGLATPLADRCLRIAEERASDIRFRWEAAAIVGYQRLYSGDFENARAELALAGEHVGREPVADFPHDPGIVSRSALTVALWFLGEAETSRKGAKEVSALAQSLDPGGRRASLTQCWVACTLAWRAQLDGDPDAAIELADHATAIAVEHRFPTWLAAATLHRSIGQCSIGRLDEGLPTLAAMVDAWRTAGRDGTGAQLHPVLMTSYFAGRLAEALLAKGDFDQAAALLDGLLAERPGGGEAFWDVELLRLRATLGRIRKAPPDVIRSDLDAARRLAGVQGARALVSRLDGDQAPAFGAATAGEGTSWP
jgi:class 3 adenylate cyclase/tetratricopeptide (TPR) repeat protein